MGKMLKNSLIFVGVSVLLGIALFINPQEIYYSYKAEETIDRPVKTLLDANETKQEEVEIEYLGKNVYSINIEDYEYLIKRIKDSESNISYKFFMNRLTCLNKVIFNSTS